MIKANAYLPLPANKNASQTNQLIRKNSKFKRIPSISIFNPVRMRNQGRLYTD